MARTVFTLGEIARSCERVEARLGDMDTKMDEQGEKIADLSARMAVFEATRPSSVKPAIAMGTGAGGAVMGLIELARHWWK